MILKPARGGVRLAIWLVALIAASPGAFAQRAHENSTEGQVSLSGKNLSDCVTESTIRGIVKRCALTIKTNRSGPRSRIITLPIEFATVSLLRTTPGGHLVVIGKMPGEYDRFAVYDGSSGHLLFQTICYFPALSPDGRWVAYQQFIPPHGMEELHVDIELYAVDAASSTLKAKPAFAAPTSWLMSNLMWSPDSTSLVFGFSEGREVGKYGNPHVVFVTGLGRGQLLRVSIKPIDLDSVYGKCTGCYLMGIDSATFNPEKPNQVMVTFKWFGPSGYRQTSVEYPKK